MARRPPAVTPLEARPSSLRRAVGWVRPASPGGMPSAGQNIVVPSAPQHKIVLEDLNQSTQTVGWYLVRLRLAIALEAGI